MTDTEAPHAGRSSRPSLSRTSFGVAAGAIAAAALIWSVLFYEASREGGDGRPAAGGAPAPVTTRSS